MNDKPAAVLDQWLMMNTVLIDEEAYVSKKVPLRLGIDSYASRLLVAAALLFDTV